MRGVVEWWGFEAINDVCPGFDAYGTIWKSHLQGPSLMDDKDKIEEQDTEKQSRVRERVPRGSGYSVRGGEDVSIKRPSVSNGKDLLKMKALFDEYRVQDSSSVTHYLDLHAGLIEPLVAAPKHIREVWGPNVVVNLEVSKDPEGEQYDSLMAYIQTTDDADTSIAKLSDFGTQWWNERHKLVRNQLDFDVEIHDAL